MKKILSILNFDPNQILTRNAMKVILGGYEPSGGITCTTECGHSCHGYKCYTSQTLTGISYCHSTNAAGNDIEYQICA